MFSMIGTVDCNLKSPIGMNKVYKFCMYATDQLAQLVEHRTTVWEVAGSNHGRTTTQGL